MDTVIFRAEIYILDDTYALMPARMRELAEDKCGCIGFIAVTEDEQDIAMSYWENQEQIRAWKQDPEHRFAQESGRAEWYKSYQAQVVEVLTDYVVDGQEP